MVFLRRFVPGLVAGFFAAPVFTGAGVVLCEDEDTPSESWIPASLLNVVRAKLPAIAPISNPDEDDDDDERDVSAADLAGGNWCPVTFPVAQGTDSPDKRWGIAWRDDWDHPQTRDCEKVPSPAEDPKRVPKKQRQILLIRHGQYENEKVKDDTVRRLTPLGRDQALITGRYLSACFSQVARRQEMRDARREAQKDYKQRQLVLSESLKAPGQSEETLRVLQADVDWAKESLDARIAAERSCGPSFLIASRPTHIYVSSLLRAQETAKLILAGFPDGPKLVKGMITDPDLCERFPCAPQPIYPKSKANQRDQKIVETAYDRYFHRPLRSDEAYEQKGSTVDIIVGHGNLIRYFALRALQLPPEAWLRQSLMHASITSITISDNGKVKISALGSFGHLPPESVTVENISHNASGTKKASA